MKKTLLFLVLALSFVSWKPDHQGWLLVVNAKSGHLSKNRLGLEDVDSRMSGFTTDKERQAKNFKVTELVNNWDSAFSSDPNAAVSFDDENGEAQEVVVKLGKPTYSNGKLSFPIVPISSQYEGRLTAPTVFIDNATIFQSTKQAWGSIPY